MAAKNMSLAANGGVLADSASEAIRDGNYTTPNVPNADAAATANVTATITFPTCTISEVRLRATEDSSGNTTAYTIIYLLVNGAWVQIGSYGGGYSATGYDSGNTSIPGTWEKCTGVRAYMTCWSGSGVARAYCYELQAWGEKADSSNFGYII